MEYTIETLEIEIARLRQALRVAEVATLTYEDVQGGSGPSYPENRRHIEELEEAIALLREWSEKNPERAEYYRTGERFQFLE